MTGNSSTEPAIEVRGLTKRYGDFTAVRGLSFDVPRGALCGFLGPNGSGKTTTIRMLLGLVTPSEGSARILGRDVSDRAALCRRVGAIVETPAFYPYLTGAENLRVLAQTSGVPLPARRLDELLTLVELRGREVDRVGTYSMGMKQRLGIAATLLTDPELLFLDEPMNGLDPAGIQQMRGLLASLRDQGKTVFVSSHQLAEVERVCTEVIIVQRGEKKLQGAVETLTRGGAGYAFRARPIDRALEVLGQNAAHAARIEEGQVLICAEEAALPALVQRLVEARVELYGLTPRASSLEEQFLALTQEAA
jgi:ABC-2 type transport system ATP-binding protein